MSLGLSLKGAGLHAALALLASGAIWNTGSAEAADLGGDCCSDLEERVAELEATTVRKGNKRVTLTISGWVTQRGSWWDDGKTSSFTVGDRDNTLSSHVNLSGSAQISPDWSAGYTLQVELPGQAASVGFCANQIDENCSFLGTNTLLSYMWVKNDRWGTINWGTLRQATDNLLVLRDLSGTIIESNAVIYDGAGMFVRPSSARNGKDLATDFTWLDVSTCLAGGGGIGADCNGYPRAAVRYDSPTFGGFSVSTSYGEDYMWDIALKYNYSGSTWKADGAIGYTIETDEGCTAAGVCSNIGFLGGGGAGTAGYNKDAHIFQFGGSVMHNPTGLFFYGLYQTENNYGTQYKSFDPISGRVTDNNVNVNDAWYTKFGARRSIIPLGHTVFFGEVAQYNDMYQGICGLPGGPTGNPFCEAYIATGNSQGQTLLTDSLITGSELRRYGLGVVQEVDAAAMHIFARWQRLELDLSGINLGTSCVGSSDGPCFANGGTGNSLKTSWEPWDVFQLGGVIFF